jgi:chromosome segregation ATPase
MNRIFHGLGFDPAPGDPDAVVQLIAQYTAVAEALAGVDPALRRAGELSEDWHGMAAGKFRQRLRDVPSDVDSQERLLRRAVEVLGRWADVLGANRRLAEELDARAVRLRRRIEAATDEVQDRRTTADLAGTLAASASATADLAAATNRLADLESELAEVLAAARGLERDHLRAADAFADELEREARPTVVLLRAAPAVRPFTRTAGQVLDRASRTAGTLAGLLLPPGTGTAPPRAAGALAAAIGQSEPR